MIEIDADEARRLAINYEHIPDRDLIRELVRRKRLRQAEAGCLFFPEMRGDDAYMGNIRENIIRSIARTIDNTHDIRPMLMSERPAPSCTVLHDGVIRPRAPGEAILTADIVYLVARDKKEG